MGKAKKFLPSAEVEVRRDVGRPWELARYVAPLWGPGAAPTAGGPMKGWHRIELDRSSPPRYVDSRTGVELSEPTEHTRQSWVVLVPSSRLRAPKPKPAPDPDDCPKRADGIHCVHWGDGEACCACKAPAMTAEQRAAQGMDP